jgi:pimeloyl-ACP methyl ester carboxylesterase
MGFVKLKESEHAPGIRPVSIFYREAGSQRDGQGRHGENEPGRTVVFLHGGWGYGVYPIDRQIEAFGESVRFVIPDRSGYGRSSPVPGAMLVDFHQRAAAETLAVLDALGIEKPVLWGHSDGAVIATMVALMAPERCERLILEAFHFYRVKPRSRGFFERFHERPEDLGEETQRLLAEDHGEDRWRHVVSRSTGAWLRIADESTRADEDLYGGRLGELRVPTVFLHGESDPRTEPDEMERVKRAAPQAEVRFVKDGQHSPHSEEGASEEFNRMLSTYV